MKPVRARAGRAPALLTKPATAPLVRSFIVLGAEPQAGQTCVTTALLRALGRHGVNAVGMKPVARGIVTAGGGWQSDELQQLAAASAFNLPARALCAHLQRDDGAALQAGELPPTLDAVVDTFRVLATWADTLVVDCATGAPFGSLALTRTLGLPFVYVVAVPADTDAAAQDTSDAAVQQVLALVAAGAECVGWIAVASASQARPGATDPRLAGLQRRMPSPCLGAFVCGSDSATLDLPRTLRVLAA